MESKLSGTTEVSTEENGNHHVTPNNKSWDQNTLFLSTCYHSVNVLILP